MSVSQGRDDMLQLLRERFARDSDGVMTRNLARGLADPLKPFDEKGRFRLSPIVLVTFLFALIAVSTFLYFGYWTK